MTPDAPGTSTGAGPGADAAAAVDDETVERIAGLGWHGLEEQSLGSWLLRAGEGFTGRSNSVLPLGDPGLPVPRALERVVAFYRERGLPPLFQVPLPLCAGLDLELEAAGWRAYNHTHLLAGPVEALTSLAVDDRLPAPTYERLPSPGWLGGYHYRGSTLPPAAAQVLALGDDPVFVSFVLDGEVAAVGRGIVDEGWLGVTAVTVDEAYRRRGLGSAVMRALGAWGAERGARHVYLQVASENAGALAMYARMGMHRHHDYHYRTLDA